MDIMPCVGEPSSLANDLTLNCFKEDGDFLKQKLIDGPKYCPYNFNDTTDAAISWNNKEGSKTSFRYLNPIAHGPFIPNVPRGAKSHLGVLDSTSFIHALKAISN